MCVQGGSRGDLRQYKDGAAEPGANIPDEDGAARGENGAPPREAPGRGRAAQQVRCLRAAAPQLRAAVPVCAALRCRSAPRCKLLSRRCCCSAWVFHAVLLLLTYIYIYVYSNNKVSWKVRDFQRGTRFLKNCDTEEGCWLY